MAQSTQKYSRSLSGSIGAGMKSLMGGSGRKYYVLEHKVSSKYHKAGENQKIIVDQIELGRDPKCQVRFDESFGTVSRRHAAIAKDGDNWKLIQLSKTNSTYLNGHKVDKEWYLQNGDEIQLSTNGPKMGFIVPEGEKGLVKSIGLTQRMSLFRQQALRPYKQAITALACVFLLALAGGGYGLYDQHLKIQEQKKYIAEYKANTDRQIAAQDSVINNLNEQNAGLMADAERRDQEMNRLKERINHPPRPITPPTPVVVDNINNAAIEACLGHIFYIEAVKFDIQFPDGSSRTVNCGPREDEILGWCGTGFLLDNGMFVTARHVAEGWYFWMDGSGVKEHLAQLNFIANNGGKVVCHFIAVSSSGRTLEFTNEQFRIDRSHDQTGNTDDGKSFSLARLDNTDYAYMPVNGSGLSFDSNKSRQLERGTKLTVLGFPLGLGANSSSDINPIYGSGIVSVPGLQNGVILTTDTNYEQGNSGGPVFYTDSDGKLVVIGIVSAGAGRNTGFIVPISVID